MFWSEFLNCLKCPKQNVSACFPVDNDWKAILPIVSRQALYIIDQSSYGMGSTENGQGNANTGIMFEDFKEL